MSLRLLVLEGLTRIISAKTHLCSLETCSFISCRLSTSVGPSGISTGPIPHVRRVVPRATSPSPRPETDWSSQWTQFQEREVSSQKSGRFTSTPIVDEVFCKFLLYFSEQIINGTMVYVSFPRYLQSGTRVNFSLFTVHHPHLGISY